MIIYAYLRPANFRPIYEKKMGVTPDPAQIRNLDFYFGAAQAGCQASMIISDDLVPLIAFPPPLPPPPTIHPLTWPPSHPSMQPQLSGLTITQTYIYYRRFPDDSLKIKALVAFVCLSEVAHAICLGQALYALTISDYGQPEHVFIAPRSLPALIFLSGLVAASVEAFFSFRIYVLSKKVYIPISSWIMSFLCLVEASVIFSVRLDKIILLGSRSKRLLIALWSVAAVHDLTVTTTLLVILVRERSNAYKRTVALLDKLIMYNIGLSTNWICYNLFALTNLYNRERNIDKLVAMKDNLIWLAVFAISVRFISNSLLASLNSRATLRAMNQVSSSSSISTDGSNTSTSIRGVGCAPNTWSRRDGDWANLNLKPRIVSVVHSWSVCKDVLENGLGSDRAPDTISTNTSESKDTQISSPLAGGARRERRDEPASVGRFARAEARDKFTFYSAPGVF
ncbi:hypothetical protein B0H14DRAFT_3164338 [Mycena olivaceomarginata]|nr:hypothetical protein B0H14DRAFT_3164338 [Mycena olivaceomarginata]